MQLSRRETSEINVGDFLDKIESVRIMEYF